MDVAIRPSDPIEKQIGPLRREPKTQWEALKSKWEAAIENNSAVLFERGLQDDLENS